MKEDRMRRLAISLAVVAAVGLSFYLGFVKHPWKIFPGKPHTVQISQKAGGPDCTIDTVDSVPTKDATVYLPTFLRDADNIRWCIANGGTTQYFVHFPGNPTPLNVPLDLNDFLVNKNQGPLNTCSDVGLPVGKRGGYDYEIRSNGPSGKMCTDPKVILK
jgi:hypothetical protein